MGGSYPDVERDLFEGGMTPFDRKTTLHNPEVQLMLKRREAISALEQYIRAWMKPRLDLVQQGKSSMKSAEEYATEFMNEDNHFANKEYVLGIIQLILSQQQ